jgi:NAD(P)-dependent dehydrogenase (short-subunit alcohol dehydrogenase family)
MLDKTVTAASAVHSWTPDLSGRVALITGGGRGLGLAMAAAFAAAGADVAIASRKFDAVAAAASEISSATGRRVQPYACHVGHWDELEPLSSRVWDDFGKIDVLVNNAGMSPLYPSLTSMGEDLVDKVIAVNLKGPMRLSIVVGSRMAEHDGGSIINVSSTASIRPQGDVIAYAAAKAGLNAMSEALAQVLAPKVRVNVLMPGPFTTDASSSWTDETLDSVRRRVTLGRPGRPEEVVGAAVYLASDTSSFVTGATLRIDGGHR